MDKRFGSFSEFWPFYVREHALPLTRRLHFVGACGALACIVGAFVAHWWLIAFAPVVGYGFSWWGHFRVEHNRPATFKYPFYSFVADWVMWAKTLTGRMDEEARRIIKG